MSNNLLLRNFISEAVIPDYRLVKIGTADSKVTTATAVADKIIGVTSDTAPAIGERVDVVVSGMAYVEAGAAIVVGSQLTTDASGRGVTAAPGAGVNNRVIGIAMETASAAGDVIQVILCQGTVQG